MGKIKSAIKRHKQSLKRKARNRHVRSTVKTAVKAVRAALEKNSVDEAKEVLTQASSIISRAGSKGVLHRKTVARKVARLSRAVHKAASGNG